MRKKSGQEASNKAAKMTVEVSWGEQGGKPVVLRLGHRPFLPLSITIFRAARTVNENSGL